MIRDYDKLEYGDLLLFRTMDTKILFQYAGYDEAFTKGVPGSAIHIKEHKSGLIEPGDRCDFVTFVEDCVQPVLKGSIYEIIYERAHTV